MDVICRQAVQNVKVAKALDDFKNGKWAQKKKQTVSEFEGEFLAKENALRSACEHDGKDQGRPIPSMDDMQKLSIANLSTEVKSEAHVMLSERRADFMVNADLAYMRTADSRICSQNTS